VGKLIRGAQVTTKGENTTKASNNERQTNRHRTISQISNQSSNNHQSQAVAHMRRIAQIISSSNSRDPGKFAAAAPLRDHLAAARAAEATRASIRSMAN
jgi:hypothetical protein